MSEYNKLIDEESTPQDTLEFQNFILNQAEQDLNKPRPTPQSQQGRPNEYGFSDPTPPPQQPASSPYAFYQLEYYQGYFSITTAELFARLYAASVPTSLNFLEKFTPPDAYGPFWIPTTLIFTLFISSTITSSITGYISGKHQALDFSLLPTAVGTVYSYTFVIPSILWAAGKWWGYSIAWIDAVGVYGYGMGVWCVVAVICLIQWELVRWCTVLLATAISGYFLVGSLRGTFNGYITITVGVLHALFALLFKILFFGSIKYEAGSGSSAGNSTLM